MNRLGAQAGCPRCGVVLLSRRSFYAGLDDSRVQRLRRSGVTLNRPRGRDTLSLAFERRVRILPLLSVGDLYALPSSPPPPPPPSVATETPPPPSASSPSEGNDATNHSKKSLRVLVVELLSLGDVDAAVPYPSMHPSYYTGWEGQQRPSGEAPSPFAVAEHTRVLASVNKKQLRQNSDTSLLRGSFFKDSNDSSYSSGSSSSIGGGGVSAEFAVALCIDPFLDVERFRREEAQVEMITGYRNILYEAAELPGGSADVVRVPALSCDTCGLRFLHEIGKLNQQSLIKGFHRIDNAAKEALVLNPRFRVEVYVPPLLLPQFTRAFAEDAWETPESTLSPGRTALYPGLPPPRTLLPLDGWVGKRPELVEAIETEGRSLMRGTQHALDGTPVTPREVLSEIRVFGREQEQQAMLEGEQATALQEGYDTNSSGSKNSAPLRPGIGLL
ncbi:hypothetical protein DQ04_00561020 [Trypanosoma grayi]|uniref:hypothetical protein n=1 Tax=Trypanosoma grayi TaxID=71804 RepID=UPI0004F4AC01|nr:hypothetical protein DQ04_00561020 [Trypanosoma grayi]KEG14233.1 hypothetical protein DQ04_00561020 [Trypanosoma grayi]